VAERLAISEVESFGGLAVRECIKIAGISTAIVCQDPGMKWQVSEANAKFLVNATDPDVEVRVAFADLTGVPSGDRIFDSGALWQLYRQEERCVFRFVSPVFGPVPYKVARFASDFRSGDVYLRPRCSPRGQPAYPLEYPLDELLLINLLARGRGAEVHAAGIIDREGNGHLFLGQSGAGKTTMARLWQNEEGVQVLSDDRIILRKQGQSVWIYGTPWHGEGRLASPASAPLQRIYFLRQGAHNRLIPQRAAEAVARLCACSFLPFFNSDGIEFTLGFFEEVVSSIPCCELSFLPDQSVVAMLKKREVE
jgi:hypothetical protein